MLTYAGAGKPTAKVIEEIADIYAFIGQETKTRLKGNIHACWAYKRGGGTGVFSSTAYKKRYFVITVHLVTPVKRPSNARKETY